MNTRPTAREIVERLVPGCVQVREMTPDLALQYGSMGLFTQLTTGEYIIALHPVALESDDPALVAVALHEAVHAKRWSLGVGFYRLWGTTPWIRRHLEQPHILRQLVCREEARVNAICRNLIPAYWNDPRDQKRALRSIQLSEAVYRGQSFASRCFLLGRKLRTFFGK